MTEPPSPESEPPPPERRGILRAGLQFGSVGLIGCVTFAILIALVVFVLVYVVVEVIS